MLSENRDEFVGGDVLHGVDVFVKKSKVLLLLNELVRHIVQGYLPPFLARYAIIIK